MLVFWFLWGELFSFVALYFQVPRGFLNRGINAGSLGILLPELIPRDVGCNGDVYIARLTRAEYTRKEFCN